MVLIAARLGAMYGAALAPDGRADRAHAGAPGTLLPPEFAARSGNLAAALGLVRSGAFTGQIPAHRFVQQVDIHLGGKNRVSQFHLADGLSLQISYVDDGHKIPALPMRYFPRLDLRISK